MRRKLAQGALSSAVVYKVIVPCSPRPVDQHEVSLASAEAFLWEVFTTLCLKDFLADIISLVSLSKHPLFLLYSVLGRS